MEPSPTITTIESKRCFAYSLFDIAIANATDSALEHSTTLLLQPRHGYPVNHARLLGDKQFTTPSHLGIAHARRQDG